VNPIQILLNPGPVNVSDRVRAAAARGDACHREPEIAATVAHVRELLVSSFASAESFDAVLITGSGTAAVEAATIAAVGPGRKLAVVDNGVYGDRILQIAASHAIATVRLAARWDRRPDPAALDELLTRDATIEAVALVHHETTTGLLNPVREIGAVTRRHGKRLVLDAVSSLGGEPLQLDEWGVDLAAATANKCICGLPGMSFVLIRSSLLTALRHQPPRSVYLDLARNLDAQRDSCGAFTPAIQILWALEAALEELREETVAARQARFARVSAHLRDGIEQAGAPCYLPRALYGHTISSFAVPPTTDYQTIHRRCHEAGFVIYAGQGPLAGSIFRVANMGQVSDEQYDRFLTTIVGALS